MRVIVALLLLGLVAPVAEAQVFGGQFGQRGRIHPVVDVRGLFSTTYDDFGLGGRVRVPLVPGLSFAPSFDYFFVQPKSGEEDLGDAWSLTGDILAELGLGLFVGGGVSLSRLVPPADLTSDKEGGTNVFLGWEFGSRRPLSPRIYAESRWVFAGSFVGNKTVHHFALGGAMAF